MRAPVLVLGFIFAWVAALAGCGDDGGGGTNKPVGTAKEITAFRFAAASNHGLAADVEATINGASISATLPAGVDLKALVATFTTTGAAVHVGAVEQVSGTTSNDFSHNLTYNVTAEDGTSRDYTVSVTAAPNNAKALTAFAFTQAKNAGLPADVTATINGTAIAATVPSGTDVKALVATFTTTGAAVKVGGAAQVSGTTANDFSNPVDYVVTAGDGSTQTYKVTVSVAAGNAKAITAFAFKSADNAGLAADVTATINGNNITATVPFATDVTALVATFTSTGASVAVGGSPQTSGTTANNFANPVTYTVTAADNSTQDFTVTITVAANTAKAITAFAFKSADNAGLAADVTATINGNNITATVPFATDVTALVATFSSTGTKVAVGANPQISGTTPNNFTDPVTYTVTAGDNSTQDFTVTITVAANPAKALTAFSFASANNPGLPADVIATIDQAAHTISATVPFATDVTALVATFSSTGASVAVGADAQTSGDTANNFTNPVTYTVTAADSSTQSYTVTVTIAANTSKAITAFSFDTVNNAGLTTNVTATIDEGNKTISATVPFGTVVTGLVASFTSTGDKVEVGGVAQASGTSANDFSNPVDYVVTAADGSTATYVVTVTIFASNEKAITAFAFTVVHNPTLSGDAVVTIAGTSISAVLPFGTTADTIKALVADFTTTGNTVSVGGVTQISGTSSNDFTNPVDYLVTAQDGSTAVFTVTVTVAKSPAKDLTQFDVLLTKNTGIKIDANTVIDAANNTISVELTAGVAINALVATFTTTGVSVEVNGAPQTSGVTANDFSNPVTYTVTAADGTTKNYVVTVKRFVTSFTFTGATGNEAVFAADGSTGLANPVVMTRTGITGVAAANAFNGSQWPTAATITINNRYYSFSVTPSTRMTLTQLSLREQASGTGPKSFTIRSSRDNFATDIVGVQATHTALARTVLALPAATFTNLAASVEFRIYGFSAGVATGTWRIDDVQLSGSAP